MTSKLTKTCSKCGIEQPLDTFAKRGAQCRTCRNEARKQWRKRNPEKVRLENQRSHQKREKRDSEACRRYFHQSKLKCDYGITLADYDQMLVNQNGRCAICCEFETQQRAGKVVQLCVDHDHETGQVRGLLCQACNMALGLFKDLPNRLRVAAEYLEQK